MLERSLKHLLTEHHFPHQKLLFLTGPRQVGKTTLAKDFLKERGNTPLYYNWDDFSLQKQFIRDPYFFEKDIDPADKRPLLVFDEIHKYSRWKKYLKGVFDRFYEKNDFLITGSGRLNLYKRGADSLFGRYFAYQLLPLSMGEILKNPIKKVGELFEEFPTVGKQHRALWEQLFHFSGFPEPYLKSSNSFTNRWNAGHKELIVRQDVRDLTNVRELSLMEHLMILLPERIGSPLSINSICEDVGVSFKTLQNWIRILEGVYYLFHLTPYSKNIKYSLKKEPKAYFWNWTEIENKANRFENTVACHLQKLVSIYTDFGLENLALHYCRNKSKQEVDFILLKDQKPWVLIETKLSETTPDPSLRHFMKALKIKKAFQVIESPGVSFQKSYEEGTVHVISVDLFLSTLL